MLDKVAVRGRTSGEVFYQLTDGTGVRTFNYGETQTVPFEELQKLMFTPGGEYLIRHSLLIAPEALEELGVTVPPEYFYTETEVTQLLENGSLDQLEDTLNFAPKGVIELIKQIGLKIELPDTRKRKLIFEKTGFNIDGALAINDILNADDEAEEQPEAPTRKATPIKVESNASPQRKAPAPAPKYKVVQKAENK